LIQAVPQLNAMPLATPVISRPTKNQTTPVPLAINTALAMAETPSAHTITRVRPIARGVAISTGSAQRAGLVAATAWSRQLDGCGIDPVGHAAVGCSRRR